ncbi:PIN domain-containing protein [Spirosoma sp. BT702]|uniref:PIN domain-containing protein n=1 Tax=Spirosoma profusum TaxID=2771354 RepID=A0A926XVB0_9BACT|nr:PIN domain-containing protein [Spirosoma profusum]MBD2700914.1 PIN domain-containing protein [Spirosoma profusum]
MNNPTGLFVDTNGLIRLLEGDELLSTLLADQIVYISVFTELEMQCKPNQPAEERKLIKSLLNDCVIVELTPQVKTEAIKVRRASRMKLMDSIVAASARMTGLPLITGDNAFERVSQLDLILLPPR